MSERMVFLTGASGLVGAEVVMRLGAIGRSVVALTHRESNIVDSEGRSVTAVPFERSADAPLMYLTGDVREPGFGLPADVRHGLAGRVEMIIHSAASTDFDADEDVYRDLNVGGAQNAAALALEWGVPLIYISTAYVCGRREGPVSEDDLSDADGFGNGYERSKFAAEQYVRNCSGLDWAVVRPGIVTGCTRTGAIRDKKNIYSVIRLITEGKLRSLPGRYDADLALAPVDFVADVIVRVVEDFSRARGRTFHAVGRGSISLRTMSDVFAEYPSFAVARFLPPSSFRVDDLGDLEREYFTRIGYQYICYFDRKRIFDTSEVSSRLGLEAPITDSAYLRTILDRCLEDRFLGAALTSIPEVIECSN